MVVSYCECVTESHSLLPHPLCSEKLGVDPAVVQHGVEGLMYLLTECSKLFVRME